MGMHENQQGGVAVQARGVTKGADINYIRGVIKARTRARNPMSAECHHQTFPTSRPPRLTSLSRQRARACTGGIPRFGTTADSSVTGRGGTNTEETATHTPMVMCQSKRTAARSTAPLAPPPANRTSGRRAESQTEKKGGVAAVKCSHLQQNRTSVWRDRKPNGGDGGSGRRY